MIQGAKMSNDQAKWVMVGGSELCIHALDFT